jgi:hypothetical protein
LRNLTITKNGVTVALPEGALYTVGSTEVGTSTEMISGRVVKDVVGYRKTISVTYGWMPAATLLALKTLLAQGGFFTVAYEDVGGETSGAFSIAPPSFRTFSFDAEGVAVWCDVTLEMTAQEVTPCS